MKVVLLSNPTIFRRTLVYLMHAISKSEFRLDFVAHSVLVISNLDSKLIYAIMLKHNINFK